jgi:rubrerythrin
MNKELRGEDILDFAIEIEMNGYAFYTKTAKKFENLKTIKLFHILAEQELKHEMFFKQLKEKQPKFETSETLEASYEIFKKEFLQTYTFGDSADTRNRIKSVATIEEAIDMAINFEKDTVVLYSSIKKHIKNDDQDLIDKIINQELAHIGRLLELRKNYNQELSKDADY